MFRGFRKSFKQYNKEDSDMKSFGKWAVTMLVSAFVTMVFIVIIKNLSKKVPIPFVSQIIEEV